jgi:hypothetical protein
MSRSSVFLAALTDELTSTSDLYERVGYAELIRLGLVPYEAFRTELVELTRGGLADVDTGRDGSTTWKLAKPAHLPARRWDGT